MGVPDGGIAGGKQPDSRYGIPECRRMGMRFGPNRSAGRRAVFVEFRTTAAGISPSRFSQRSVT
ncbi:hypothetical protein TNCT1_43160 [Streptomyces sp. 1-11]|nr:hypothetical protein TNCT1_43160 [Streptomyces sp. 1-11]